MHSLQLCKFDHFLDGLIDGQKSEQIPEKVAGSEL
jgi:hypothetical protein